ncbi:hypothetical protein [Streptomyces sp. NPDC046985]|uniref:hypothetical protein n=1 Tax=Streptomyces sp. NPDC046985 TaxID=3155377 RepID=UPI0033FE1437
MTRPTLPRRAVARRALCYPLTDGRRPEHGRRLTAHQAAACIRSARKQTGKAVAAVHVYATADRDGTALHIGYVHYTPGHWSGVDDAADVYEIPTDALTDL